VLWCWERGKSEQSCRYCSSQGNAPLSAPRNTSHLECRGKPGKKQCAAGRYHQFSWQWSELPQSTKLDVTVYPPAATPAVLVYVQAAEAAVRSACAVLPDLANPMVETAPLCCIPADAAESSRDEYHPLSSLSFRKSPRHSHHTYRRAEYEVHKEALLCYATLPEKLLRKIEIDVATYSLDYHFAIPHFFVFSFNSTILTKISQLMRITNNRVCFPHAMNPEWIVATNPGYRQGFTILEETVSDVLIRYRR